MFFGTSGAHFREYRVTRRKPLIPIEQEGADLMRFPRLFRAPKNKSINSYVYVGILRWVFKNNRIPRNELNPPSPVRTHLEAFHVFQLRGLVGIPA